MSQNKMLIDATHPEETRVVVLRDGRVEEFDYESAARKLLRGSIFLAKITRVEPSLQAAFVDYGGNRHGFLAFAEIHPDYYQIPHADKMALLAQEASAHERFEDDDDDDAGVTDAPDSDDDDDDDEAVEITEAGEDQLVSARDDAADDADETDADEDDIDVIEASAIDVTDYLPPEPASEDDQADAPDTNSQAPSDSSDDEGSPPPGRTIAAAISGDDETLKSPPIGGTDDDAGHADAVHAHEHLPDVDLDAAAPTALTAEAEVVVATAEPMRDAGTSDTGDAEAEFAAPGDVSANGTEDADVDHVHIGAPGQEQPYITDYDPIPRGQPAPRRSNGAAKARNRDDADDEAEPAAPARQRRRMRQYKIQEVIKRRQIVLVQVVKEERGNKGAALTTYLSLAGRYTVLMPNTARGGGISRKITNVQDRKRLKAIAQELEVPEGMGLIIRTAGAARTKQEIKRDFEYLLRLWENVRELTLNSTAPNLVYEEGDLIKRSIRDLYTKDIDEVVVAGEAAHKEAKAFMRMLMPSHAKNVIKYEEPQSLFAKYRIEQQLNAMFSPYVQLRSGGYLVINQTEALVAIDVNSGKSTREFSIEETALNTNLEAAEEVARQLKLRDLAGLVVIDFIDMEEKRNNRAVERKLKDSLRSDRARIQVGRISHFGLLEMSRQRLRTGVLEGSTTPCQHCLGSGIVRSTESVALAVLRGLEDALMSREIQSCMAHTSADVALYLLNHKRQFIQELEASYGVTIHVMASDKQQGANFAIEPMAAAAGAGPRLSGNGAVNIDSAFSGTQQGRQESRQESRQVEDDAEAEAEGSEKRSRRRRRRRGGRGSGEAGDDHDHRAVRHDRAGEDEEAGVIEIIDDQEPDDDDASAGASAEDGAGRSRRPRRRGRRGGRRHREQRAAGETAVEGESEASTHEVGLPVVEKMPATEPVVAQSQPMFAETETTEAPPLHTEATAEAADAADMPAPATEVPLASAEGQMEPTGTPSAMAPAITPQPEPVTDAQEAKNAKEPEPATPPAAEPSLAPAASTDRSARSQPVASAPVLQRVIVGQTAEAEEGDTATEETEESKPQSVRRGWWQRQFGG